MGTTTVGDSTTAWETTTVGDSTTAWETTTSRDFTSWSSSSRIQPLFLQTSVLTRDVAWSTTVGANVSTSQRTSTGNDSRLSSTWVSATWPASVGTQGSGWRVL